MQKSFAFVFILGLLALAAFQGFAADEYYIATVAGTGKLGYSGDAGQAVRATLNNPCGVYVDPSGAFYICDNGNNRIRKVDKSGVISTVVGNGKEGFSGDGGPALNASLNGPVDLDFDLHGNLYFADLGSNRIRKVDIFGTITTIAGNGKPGYSGDGGPAASAQITEPVSVAISSSGDVYLASYKDCVVRKIDRDGIISTVAGNGEDKTSGDGGPATSATLSGPCGICFDRKGNLYIAEVDGHRVRKVDPSGTITTFAGPGSNVPIRAADLYRSPRDGVSATDEFLRYPHYVCADAMGNVYIADTDNHLIRMVDLNGLIWVIAGSQSRPHRYSGDGGLALDAGLNWPQDVAAAEDGTVYIADRFNNVIRKLYRP